MKAKELLGILAEDPYRNPPPYEKLVGDLAGFFSRRINIQHRLVYKVIPGPTDDGLMGTVKVLRMWTNYE